jgi:hypothetical protein
LSSGQGSLSLSWHSLLVLFVQIKCLLL